MAIFITGVAGFIGSNLAKVLISNGEKVIGFDNLSLGRLSNLDMIIGHPQFHFEQTDLADFDVYRKALVEAHAEDRITEVWHMAANSDIPAGISDARTDLCNTFMTTFNTLELMRELGIGVILFASSSAIYGDLKGTSLTENTGPLLPISNYGAMKLASEAIISAAIESFLELAFIFRFPNVIGTPATHGVILDFARKLKATPDNLVVLGDGTQRKSYLHVEELIDAMLFIHKTADRRINIFNIGAGDQGVTVRFIAEQVVNEISQHASITYGEGNKGWVGDVPEFVYSIDKLRLLGWEPCMNSMETVRRAVREIIEQEITI
jgi:UDP-glucose 4-epimerase